MTSPARCPHPGCIVRYASGPGRPCREHRIQPEPAADAEGEFSADAYWRSYLIGRMLEPDPDGLIVPLPALAELTTRLAEATAETRRQIEARKQANRARQQQQQLDRDTEATA